MTWKLPVGLRVDWATYKWRKMSWEAEWPFVSMITSYIPCWTQRKSARARQVLTSTFRTSSAKSPPALANQIPQPRASVCIPAHTLYSQRQLLSRCLTEWLDVHKPLGSGGFSLTAGQHLRQYWPPNSWPGAARRTAQKCSTEITQWLLGIFFPQIPIRKSFSSKGEHSHPFLCSEAEDTGSECSTPPKKERQKKAN